MCDSQTVSSYVVMFQKRFEALNQEDSKAKIPGVLYGRYAADAYGNKALGPALGLALGLAPHCVCQDGGNPWVLITAALANLLYQANLSRSFLSTSRPPRKPRRRP